MKIVHTHYDNLRLARNASYSDIRAAYINLALKHHPDKNPGSASSLRAMQIINASYAVLVDEQLRTKHDAWIEQQERSGLKTKSTAYVQPFTQSPAPVSQSYPFSSALSPTSASPVPFSPSQNSIAASPSSPVSSPGAVASLTPRPARLFDDQAAAQAGYNLAGPWSGYQQQVTERKVGSVLAVFC